MYEAVFGISRVSRVVDLKVFVYAREQRIYAKAKFLLDFTLFKYMPWMYTYIYCFYVVNLYISNSFHGTMCVSINMSFIEGWASVRLKSNSFWYKLDCQEWNRYLAQIRHQNNTSFFAHTLSLGRKQVYSPMLCSSRCLACWCKASEIINYFNSFLVI